MAFMAPLLPYLTAAGTALNVVGAVKSADAANDAAAIEKQQLDAAALAVEGESQYEAQAQRRKSELMLSRALAVGAASGAGTQGLDSLLRDIGAEGETAAQYALYGGTEKAKGMRYKGDVGVSTAKAQGKATVMSAIGQGAMSLAATYGGGKDGIFSSGKSAPVTEATPSAVDQSKWKTYGGRTRVTFKQSIPVTTRAR